MEKLLFETSKKASKKYKKASKRPLGWALRFLRFLFNLALVLVAVTLAAISGLYAYVIYAYGDHLESRYPDLVQNSSVYDVNGDQIGEFKAEENRRTVGPEDLGEYLPQAVVAVEDRRFYEHWGMDFTGISRAAWEDLRALTPSQGGSTITEQLVKNLYISEERRGNASLWRRSEQAALSFVYERRHTKEEVLTAYLNTVYFGDGAYGAEEAAKRYFGKSARDLNLDEAASLAGFLHAPSTYLSEDGEGTQAAIERRNDVLGRMERQGMISAEELSETQELPLEFAPDPSPEDPAYGPFMEAVRREVEGKLGPESLQSGGLEIYTTLDPGLQRAAVASIDRTLYLSDDPSGAVVSVEPQSGAIKVLAGQAKDFNLALDARRQPGSSFKPFVLATALKQFVSPETTYVSHNLSLDYQGKAVEVRNYDGIERGRITLGQAMAESDNTVYVQLALDLGLENVTETAKAMGVTTPVDPYPATAIGGLETGVGALEMASAYATLAAGGIRREPYAVERVDSSSFGERSESVYDHKLEGRRVLTGNQAAAATEVLRGVVQSGTASFYHNLDDEIGRPSAGKTGTSDDFVDAWYIGYTPRLSTAVWVGYPEGRTPMLDVHEHPVVNGETLPMDIWSLYMARATAGNPVLEFPRPDRREFVPLYRGYAADTGSYPSNTAPISSADDVRRRYGYSVPGES